MTNKTQQTVYIKWVRSGIGFTRRQKEMVRSLGLRRLNEIVERVDTPQIRGLVARIPHLVEIVRQPRVSPAWTAAPEYTILPNETVPAEPGTDEAGGPAEAPAQPAESSEVATGAVEDSATPAADPPKAAKANAAKDKTVKAATAGKKKAKLAAKATPSAKAEKK